MNHDLAHYLEPAEASRVDFHGKYPSDYLVEKAPEELPVWHLVGGLDPLDASELKGTLLLDGEPVLLDDWIADGLSVSR